MPIEQDLEDETATRPLGTLLERQDWADPPANTPWLQRAGGDVRERAEELNQERSQRARTTDELYNAPIAETYAQWAQAPNRYDIPGVDTVPSHRLGQRAEAFLDRAKQADAVRRVETIEGDTSTRGQHQRSLRSVRLNEDLEDHTAYPRDGRPYTLAHEVGHAADAHAADVKREEVHEDDEWRVSHAMGHELAGHHRIFNVLNEGDTGIREPDMELAEELKGMSERVRGRITEDSIAYRKQTSEITADAIALTVLEPRAARRDYPYAYQTIQDEFFGRLRPLEDDI